MLNRLLGYANEVGEAFRALVHVNWVRLSYGVASAYVLADTKDKAEKTEASLPQDEEGRTAKIGVAAFDTLLWQALASVIIPGFTINRICAGSLYAMARTIPQVEKIILTYVVLYSMGVIRYIIS
jgi:fission process protein 1